MLVSDSTADKVHVYIAGEKSAFCLIFEIS